MPRSYEWSLPFRISDKNFVCISHLSHPCYNLRSSSLCRMFQILFILKLKFSLCIINLSSIWRWEVSLRPQSFYPMVGASGTQWVGGWVGKWFRLWRTFLETCVGVKIKSSFPHRHLKIVATDCKPDTIST
jgi:hypothetical protein